MKKYFNAYERSNYGYSIGIVWDTWLEDFERGELKFEGSFALVAARLMGMSYPDWLRYEEQHGARLYGKGEIYVCAVWDKPDGELSKLIEMLNERANKIFDKISIRELRF